VHLGVGVGAYFDAARRTKNDLLPHCFQALAAWKQLFSALNIRC